MPEMPPVAPVPAGGSQDGPGAPAKAPVVDSAVLSAAVAEAFKAVPDMITGATKRIVASEVARAVEAMKGADAVVFQTEWPEFRHIRTRDFCRLMKKPVVIDGRRTVDGRKLRKAGVRYLAIGAPNEP